MIAGVAARPDGGACLEEKMLCLAVARLQGFACPVKRGCYGSVAARAAAEVRLRFLPEKSRGCCTRNGLAVFLYPGCLEHATFEAGV